MTSALGAARSDDISSLREVALVYVGTHSPQGRLEPPIKSKSAKSDTRGWKHKGLARYLCPIQYLDAFDKDPEGFGDFFLCFLPVAHTLWLSRTSRRAKPFTADDYPAFMYDEDLYDPEDLQKGLLRHPYPICVCLLNFFHCN